MNRGMTPIQQHRAQMLCKGLSAIDRNHEQSVGLGCLQPLAPSSRTGRPLVLYCLLCPALSCTTWRTHLCSLQSDPAAVRVQHRWRPPGHPSGTTRASCSATAHSQAMLVRGAPLRCMCDFPRLTMIDMFNTGAAPVAERSDGKVPFKAGLPDKRRELVTVAEMKAHEVQHGASQR